MEEKFHVFENVPISKIYSQAVEKIEKSTEKSEENIFIEKEYKENESISVKFFLKTSSEKILISEVTHEFRELDKVVAVRSCCKKYFGFTTTANS
jgi:hypothetical protein